MWYSVILASLLVFLPLNTLADDSDTTIPPVYKKAGDTVVLSPGSVTNPITSILWKHGPDIAMEWFDGTTYSYRQFEVRGFLNSSTGELTIRGLTRDDNGIYTSEINDQVTNTTEVLVISPVSKPTVSISCDGLKSYCVLTCEGNTSDAEPITYMWTSGGETWTSPRDLIITLEDLDLWYSCELHNPVSSETSDQVFNPIISCLLGIVFIFVTGIGLSLGHFFLTWEVIYKNNRRRGILAAIFICVTLVELTLCLIFLTYKQTCELIYRWQYLNRTGIVGLIFTIGVLVVLFLWLIFLTCKSISRLYNNTPETGGKRIIEGILELIFTCVLIGEIILALVIITYKPPYKFTFNNPAGSMAIIGFCIASVGLVLCLIYFTYKLIMMYRWMYKSNIRGEEIPMISKVNETPNQDRAVNNQTAEPQENHDASVQDQTSIIGDPQIPVMELRSQH